MSALLFIPSNAAACGRRVDLAHLASRFVEVDEPAPVRREKGWAGRLALLLLILLGTIGDTVLVSQHEALASSLAASVPAAAAT